MQEGLRRYPVNLLLQSYLQSFCFQTQESVARLAPITNLLLAAGCLLLGAPLLYRLKRLGAQICVGGATIGLFGGIWGSLIINQAASTHLGDALTLTYEIWIYLCGASMGLCLAVAGLPLLNARARLALQPRVELDLREEA